MDAVGRAATLRALWERLEIPTWLVVASTYGGWFTLTWYAAALPWWATWLALGGILGWYNSLQHEALHGHPTNSSFVNDAIGLAPLGLWMPFLSYRRLHLLHHRIPEITDPQGDPESFYFTESAWQKMPRVVRHLLIFNNSLLGRLTVGPAIAAGQYWYGELRDLLTGDRRRVVREWVGHLILTAPLLYWILIVCDIPLWLYAFACYGGLSITLNRSYTEHRPAAAQEARSIVVEAGLFWRLMYLGNNFHALHHRSAEVPWFHLTKSYQDNRDEIVGATENFVFRGYSDVFRRYILRPKDTPVHPSTADQA